MIDLEAIPCMRTAEELEALKRRYPNHKLHPNNTIQFVLDKESTVNEFRTGDILKVDKHRYFRIEIVE